MKKINLSKIMKRAWKIKKENDKNVFSLCLKMAWEEYKNNEIIIKIRSNIHPSKIFTTKISLEGTEKQINYAWSIISNKIDNVNFAASNQVKSRKMTLDQYNAGMQSLMDQFSEMTSAKYVIENVR